MKHKKLHLNTRIMREPNRKQTKIFIVEDDPSYRNMLHKFLRDQNYHDISQFDSVEGFMSELHQSPDVVFLNFHMKGLNGISVLREVKERDSKVHMILLSPREKVQIAINAFVYGVFDYVTKGLGDVQRSLFIIRKIENRRDSASSLTRLRRRERLMTAVIACMAVSLGVVSWL